MARGAFTEPTLPEARCSNQRVIEWSNTTSAILNIGALAIKMLGTDEAILRTDLADDYERLALSLSSVKVVPPTQ
jgi:hypothetical protein